MLSREEWEEIRDVRPRTPFESKLARPNARIRTGEPLHMVRQLYRWPRMQMDMEASGFLNSYPNPLMMKMCFPTPMLITDLFDLLHETSQFRPVMWLRF